MMNSMRPLAGRVALVTGAGPGLGRALARGLAEAGANLVVCDINEASLAAARAAVEEAGASA
jgi:3-oxoacyl-[acyl-carrier protein] reductase